MDLTKDVVAEGNNVQLYIDKNGSFRKYNYITGADTTYQVTIPQSDKISSYVGVVNIASNYGTSYNNNIINGQGSASNLTMQIGDYDGGRNAKKYVYNYIQGDTIYIQGYDEANFYYGQSSSNGIKLNSSGLKYKRT